MVKKNQNPVVQCIDCERPQLMRNGNNPIIAVCPKKNERLVASCMFRCEHFKQRTGPMVLVPFVAAM